MNAQRLLGEHVGCVNIACDGPVSEPRTVARHLTSRSSGRTRVSRPVHRTVRATRRAAERVR